MTELVHWMLLGLMELPNFELKHFDKKYNTTTLKIYVNGETFDITINDITKLVQAADKPIIKDVVSDSINVSAN